MNLTNNVAPTIADILRTKKLTLSAEIIPPRNGSDVDAVASQVAFLSAVPVDFISVTKGAGGSLRGGTLPIAQIIQNQFGVSSLAHFTCRDYTVEEIENTMMDHNYFGVHNILALRGDPPDGMPNYFIEKAAKNRHQYAYQLVEQIKRLNEGKYLLREGFDFKTGEKPNQDFRPGTPTRFCIGVAAHPELEPKTARIDYLFQKVNAGAEFAITQMIFSDETYSQFLEETEKAGIKIPILPGIHIVNKASSATFMQNKFGCKIPADLMNALEKVKEKEDGKKVALEWSTRFCERLIKAGAPGIHIFVMNDAKSSSELLKIIKS